MPSLPALAQASEGGDAWPVVSGVLAVALALLGGAWLRRERILSGRIERSAADSSADLAESRGKLASEAERLSAILESILEAIITTDTEGRIKRLNRAAETLLDKRLDEVAGRRVREVLPLRGENEARATFDPIAELRSSNAPTNFEAVLFHFESPKGKDLRLELSGAPVKPAGELKGFVLALRDVTERQMVEAELAKAQKLESLGLLASGIAHDFNNLLTIVLGNFSLLQTDEDLPEALGQPLDEIEKALLRARGLADQLLTFASGGVPRNRPTDFGELVRSSASVVFRGDPELCSLDLPSDLPAVDADPEQIGQVLNNLMLEARQGAGDGRVEISARQVKIGLGKTKLRPGSYVRLDIFDGGDGKDPEELTRIFEPYVSTRKGGTGMGLATSQAIVKRHRGAIEVTSEPGEGTTFSVLLRSTKESLRQPAEATTSPRKTSAERGRVLIMDDEHSILALLSAALKRLGFETVTTTEGRAALGACQSALDDGQPFHLAILDLTIPGGMGGVETAAGLRELQADLLLVASSGYSQNPALVEPRRHGFDEALVKPYRIPDLAKLFDRLLGPPA